MFASDRTTSHSLSLAAELDVQCFHCHGEGCSLCKGEGWIEILGLRNGTSQRC